MKYKCEISFRTQYGGVMATWIVHLRIADYLLSQVPNLVNKEYVVGNIAPDAGEPNKDWTEFTPPGYITHWIDQEIGMIQLEKIEKQYLHNCNYRLPFYLGYYTHLVVDTYWGNLVKQYNKTHFGREKNVDPEIVKCFRRETTFIEKEYYSNNKNKKAFEIFLSITEFENRYFDYFSKEAIIKKVDYIQKYMLRPNEPINCVYLNAKLMDKWVKKVSTDVLSHFEEKALLK